MWTIVSTIFILVTISSLGWIRSQDSLVMNTSTLRTKMSTASNVSVVNVPYTLPPPIAAHDVQFKIHHIGLLKVHKAGSTTLQNVLFRFGINHNLSFVIPKNLNYIWSKSEAVPLSRGNHHDILAVHTRFEQRMFDDLLPPDSVKIGIVRDPLKRMISAAYYYRDVSEIPYLRNIPKENFIHELVSYPEIYDTEPFSETRNSMGRDFGFSSKIALSDKNKIKQALEYLKSQFHFVLILEQFDESLVFMKRLFNWSLSDILYIQTNSHPHEPEILSDKEILTFRKTCFLDYEIYEFFVDVFEEKILKAGNDFKDEVAHFKSILPSIAVFCSQGGGKRQQRFLEIRESRWNKQIKVLESDCTLMNMEELIFIDHLRIRHMRYNPDPSGELVFSVAIFVIIVAFCLRIAIKFNLHFSIC